MASRLQDDLIHEFREEKKMITAQMDLFNPMALSLRKPVAQRLASKGLILFMEIFCWLAALSTIPFGIFLSKLYPFYLLFRLNKPELRQSLGGVQEVQYLQWSIYGLIALLGLLFLFLARALARIRRKNDVLSLTGKHIKILLGQHLTRKAAIDAIEQRHFMELPGTSLHYDINDIPNPGYDEGSIERLL